jgi:hypothetical protein
MSDCNSESDEEVQQNKLASVLKRYQSGKGAADKRKETSKANMAKARAAKLAGLAAAKEKKSRQVEISDSSDSDSDSDEEEVVITKKKSQKGKGKPVDEAVDDGRMARLEKAMMKKLMKKFCDEKLVRVPQKKGKKTIIQINQPAQVSSSAPIQAMKRDILNF